MVDVKQRLVLIGGFIMDALDKLRKHMLVDGFEIVLDLQASQGCYIVDRKTGDKYLDFFSFFASSPLGMNHPDLVNEEFLKKLALASVNKPSCSDFYSDEMADFVDTFSRVGIPSFLPNLFMIDGGALAVENTLKAAFDWKVRKNFKKGYSWEKGSKVIHFEQAFHGRSGYTLSITNTADPRKTQYFPKFTDWPRISIPNIIFPLEENLEKVKAAEERSIAQINNAVYTHKDDIAAIIIEPIQAEGGDNHFRPEFFWALRKIADENDIMLIYDEVQTGAGMTGKFWGFEHFGEKGKPDIISFGKKMQICGILASDRIKNVDKSVFEESSRINSTWGGNITDMVRAQKFLEIIERDNLVENSAKQGDYLIKQVYELQSSHPDIVSQARGKGLMIAFSLPNAQMRDKIIKKAYDKKVIILPCGNTSIRFRPPLIIEENEIDKGMDVLREVVKNVNN